MNSVIISDTTSLIVLEKLAALGLLCKLFEQVLIPAVVLAELQAGSPNITVLLEDSPCFTVDDVPASKRLAALLLLLDAGEANAIELATSLSLPLIIGRAQRSPNCQTVGHSHHGICGAADTGKSQQTRGYTHRAGNARSSGC